MPSKDIFFGEFAPDRGGFPVPKDPGYLIQAINVRPTPGGYRPAAIDEEVTSAATLAAVPKGAAGFSIVSTARHYAGTAGALYESSDIGATWNDNSGAAYSASTTFWDFALFGSNVIAVNGIDVPQTKLITAAVTDNFAALAGSPPIAAAVARIRDHVVLGNLSTNAYAVQWGEIGDPECWPTPLSSLALASEAGLQENPKELGVVTDLVGGEKFGLVFQVSGITRMTYVGGNLVYQFDTFERSRGTGFQSSAIMVSGYCYYASSLGIFRTDGYVVEDLSTGLIQDALVRDFLSHTESASAFGPSVAYDARTSTVMWNTAGASYVLCYHIPYQRFSIIELATGAQTGMLYSVRNHAAQAAVTELPYAFNASRKLVSFTDQTSVTTTIRTAFFELFDGIAQIVGVEPLGKGSAISVAAKSIMALSSVDLSTTSGYTAASSPTRSHLYRIRQSGRYHSLRLTDTSAASDIYQGVRVHYEPVSRL
jgi:hypothetical protein